MFLLRKNGTDKQVLKYYKMVESLQTVTYIQNEDRSAKDLVGGKDQW